MKEKVLINENQIQVNDNLNKAIEAAAVINERLTPALATIGIELNNDVLKDCLAGATATKKAYFDAVGNDVKKIMTPAIKKQMRDEAEIAWEHFADKLAGIRAEARNAVFLTVNDGKSKLTPENAAKLAEMHKVYLTDPAEIEAYNLHVEIVALLNQMFKGNPPHFWPALFQCDSAGTFTRNDMTDYSRLV